MTKHQESSIIESLLNRQDSVNKIFEEEFKRITDDFKEKETALLMYKYSLKSWLYRLIVSEDRYIANNLTQLTQSEVMPYEDLFIHNFVNENHSQRGTIVDILNYAMVHDEIDSYIIHGLLSNSNSEFSRTWKHIAGYVKAQVGVHE